MDIETYTEAFTYLDNLREAGTTNMFGAAEYLVRKFGYNRKVARVTLQDWMDTFDEDNTIEERVTKALEN